MLRASAYERLEELRRLLNLSKRQMMLRVGLKPATYSMWRPGKQQPSLDSLALIALYWHVSLDSLMGRGKGLEPSPDLRIAQCELVNRVKEAGEVSGTPGHRLVMCWEVLAGELLPSLSMEAWVDWIGWTGDEWQLARQRKLEPGGEQIQAAAFFLGWESRVDAWRQWLLNGKPWAFE